MLQANLEAHVSEQTEQIQALAAALTLAEEQERYRIAQYLHDDLQQLLIGIGIQAQLLNRLIGEPCSTEPAQLERAATLAEHLNRLTKEGVQSVRTLAVELSPPVLDGEGLVEALEWLATHMRDTHALSIEVVADAPIHISDHDKRVMLFRIARELLLNVVKHADTGRALVHLTLEDNAVRVAVLDEGRGFDLHTLDSPTAGFGLFSVRERLRLVGGHLTIASTPGRGTQVHVHLPLAS